MLPNDLLEAYVHFTSLATQHGYVYAALMVSKDPVSATVIGNTNERGSELAALLRLHADYIDKQTAAGRVYPEVKPS